MEENVFIDFLSLHELAPLKADVDPRDEHSYVSGLKEKVESEGPEVLFTRYAPLVKLLERSSRTKAIITTTILDILDISWDYLVNKFKKLNGDFSNVDKKELVELQMLLATLFFLTYRAVLEIENFRVGEVQQKFLRNVGSDKKKAQNTTNFPYWSKYRQRFMKCCLKICKNDLNTFWGNHEVASGASFLRALLLTCMTILRQASADVVNPREEELKNSIYELLGILSTKYGEEQSILSRLVPIVKESEEGARVVSGALRVLTNDFGREMVIFTAVRNVLEMYTENLTKESAADRSLGIFLDDITKINVKAIVKCLPLLLEFLDAESFSVRNSVLSICTELLIASKEHLGDISQKLREEILDILLQHLLDGNSFVRSKVIQFCTRLIKEDFLYTREKIQISHELQKRVFDKTPTVRKHAINFLSELAKILPHLVKFTPEVWDAKLQKSQAEFVRLLTKNLDNVDLEIKVAVKEFLDRVCTGTQIKKYRFESPEIAMADITRVLQEKNYWEACAMMHSAIRSFQHESTFQLLLAFRDFEIYVRFFKSTLNIPMESEEKELEEGDVIEPEAATEQRVFLEYLDVCTGLSHIYAETLPKMARLLESGLDSDRTEVIGFLAQLVINEYEPDEATIRSVLDSVRHINGKTMKDQMESFCIIFFRGIAPASDKKRHQFGMLKKLIELANSAEPLQKASIVFVLRELLNAGKLELGDSVQTLWDAFCLKIPSLGEEYSRGAVFLLGILGTIERDIITLNLNTLLEHGFGPRGYQDLQLMRAVCEAIHMLRQVNSEKTTEIRRFDSKDEQEHQLFEKLSRFIVHGLERHVKISDDGYVKVAEIAIHMIYGLYADPSDIITPLVKEIANHVFLKSSEVEAEEDNPINDARSENGIDHITNGEKNDDNLVMSQPETTREKSKAEKQLSAAATTNGVHEELKMSEGLLYRYVSVIKFLFGAHTNFYDKLVKAEMNRRKAIVSAVPTTTTQRKKSRQQKEYDLVDSISNAAEALKQKSNSRRNRSTVEALINLAESSRRSLDASAISEKSALSNLETPRGRGSSRPGLRDVMSNENCDRLMSKLSETSDVSVGSSSHEIQEMLGTSAYDREMEMINNYMGRICENGCFKMYRTHILYLCSRLNTFKYTKLKVAVISCLSKTMSISSKCLTETEHLFLDAWKNAESSAVRCELIRSSVLLNVKFPSQMEQINACILTGLNDDDAVVRMATLDSIMFLTLKDLMKTRDQLADASICLLDPSYEVQEMVKHFFSKCNEKSNTIQNAIPEILSRLIVRTDVDQVQLQDILKHLLVFTKQGKRVESLVDKILNLFQKLKEPRQSQDLAFCLRQFTYNDKSFKYVVDHLPHYSDKLGDDAIHDAFAYVMENARKNCRPEHKLKLDDFEKDYKTARAACLNNLRVLNNINAPDPTIRRRNGHVSEESNSGSGSGEDTDAEQQPQQRQQPPPENAASQASSSESSEDSDFVQVRRPKTRTPARRGRPARQPKANVKAEPVSRSETEDSD